FQADQPRGRRMWHKLRSQGTPSLALKIGYALKRCVNIVIGYALRMKQQKDLPKISDSFWRPNGRIASPTIR
ncbi:Hypothetical predicted protein, partial [Paramuricea clavata]